MLGAVSRLSIRVRLLKAFIVPKEDVEVTDKLIEEIESFSKIYLPERDIAMAYRFLDKLPLTLVGKVDYRELEEME